MSGRVDLLRLMRAVHLDACRAADLEYVISGGATVHRVNLAGVEPCDCYDHRVDGHRCKHLLRVALAEGDSEVLRALRQLIPLPKRGRRVRAAA